MTWFIDVPTVSRLVQRKGIEQILIGMAAMIEDDFKRWESFEKCARVASHSQDGVIELMPVSDHELYAFKYVNGHPINTSKQLPTVMAFGALSKVETGYPLLLSELTLTTAFRTAATSAMAAKRLARPDSKIMGMIGCGAQSEFQTIAFHTIVGIDEIRIYDVDDKATQKLAANLKQFTSLCIIPVLTPEAATRGADIVTTVTADKAWATILNPDMVEPGMHINAVGGDCPGKKELHKDILGKAKIFVEYAPQTRIEGEIQQLDSDHPVTELWTVLMGQNEGRDNSSQITIFDSVGFALEDYSALRYMYKLCIELEEGEKIELVPTLDNPKDLFSLATSDGISSWMQKSA